MKNTMLHANAMDMMSFITPQITMMPSALSSLTLLILLHF
jgi:hypothetical protein